jgi:hypothetical protein
MSEVSEHKAIVVAAITRTQDCHLFPTVSKVDVQNTSPWRDSGRVVQLAFMCGPEPICRANKFFCIRRRGCVAIHRSFYCPQPNSCSAFDDPHFATTISLSSHLAPAFATSVLGVAAPNERARAVRRSDRDPEINLIRLCHSKLILQFLARLGEPRMRLRAPRLLKPLYCRRRPHASVAVH